MDAEAGAVTGAVILLASMVAVVTGVESVEPSLGGGGGGCRDCVVLDDPVELVFNTTLTLLDITDAVVGTTSSCSWGTTDCIADCIAECEEAPCCCEVKP